MKLVRRSLVAFCLIILFLTPCAFGKKRRHPAPAWGVPEIFSSLYLEGETGDVGGMEVIFVPADRDWVVVVSASGVAYDPVLVQLGGDQNTIEFTVPDTGTDVPAGKYTGKKTRAGLTLWHDGKRLEFLPRQSAASYR